MNQLIKKQNPNYGWYILALTGLTYAIIAGVNRLCMPVLFTEISKDLGLNATKIGVIWGMDPLAGVFVGLPAGLLADRFGIKKTLTILCILAGIFGVIRGFSTSFLTLSATMFLFGLMSAAAPAIIPKVTAEWFNDKRLALSNALLKMGVPYPFAFVLSASMQFVPVLVRRLGNIRDAQRARGIPIEGGLSLLIHLPALAGPLLIQAFKFADELAEAMEARGFGIPGRRFRHEPRFRWMDWIVVIISVAVLVMAFWKPFR